MSFFFLLFLFLPFFVHSSYYYVLHCLSYFSFISFHHCTIYLLTFCLFVSVTINICVCVSVFMIVLVNVLSMFLCNKCPNAFLSSNQTSEEEEDNSSYTLTFNVEFQNDNDTVYFAHSYPYTYSDLQVRI